MLIEMQTSRSTKSGPRNTNNTARALFLPAMIAALLMAAALTGCSAGEPRFERSALLIHTQAPGQDNANLTNNFVAPRRMERQRGTLYASATPHLTAR